MTSAEKAATVSPFLHASCHNLEMAALPPGTAYTTRAPRANAHATPPLDRARAQAHTRAIPRTTSGEASTRRGPGGETRNPMFGAPMSSPTCRRVRCRKSHRQITAERRRRCWHQRWIGQDPLPPQVTIRRIADLPLRQASNQDAMYSFTFRTAQLVNRWRLVMRASLQLHNCGCARSSCAASSASTPAALSAAS